MRGTIYQGGALFLGGRTPKMAAKTKEAINLL